MIILYLLFAFVAGFCVAVAMLPNDFKYLRSLSIKASPAEIFPHINSPRLFNEWNPWAKIEPDSKATFEGPEEGVGSCMRWQGSPRIGAGSMTQVENLVPEYIRFRMDFLKPMQATHIAEFTLAQQGEKTLVTWSMSGTGNFVGKLMGVLFNCEKMTGTQFEKGLINLKEICEQGK